MKIDVEFEAEVFGGDIRVNFRNLTFEELANLMKAIKIVTGTDEK